MTMDPSCQRERRARQPMSTVCTQKNAVGALSHAAVLEITAPSDHTPPGAPR